MENILTLIGNIRGAAIVERQVTLVSNALATAGARVGRPDWLAPRIACDLAFTGILPAAADRAARTALRGAPIDLIAQPGQDRRKRLLLADMESTMIENEMLDEIAALEGREIDGLGARIADITRRAMNGELDFAAAMHERIGLLAGQPADLLEQAWAKLRVMPGARALVATMRQHGAHTALVSGGFRFFTARVRERLGFDEDQANDLILADGRIAGIAEPILGREAKLAALQRLLAQHDLPASAALTVGDGANDLAMLQAAGLGIAFHAKPAVGKAATWRVDHGDLTALLYAQGYREEEIVTG